jgi:fructose-1,6-bisphosphatase/inositol monophosphatase family enzyme
MKNTNNKNNMYQLMEAMVKEAIQIIQSEAAVFSQKVKTHYSGSEDDLVTSADLKAQDMYVSMIQKLFPNEGLIGEENGLNTPAKEGHGYFTIDPLDGTKAFGRMQSIGSGTMIAHVNKDGVVDAVCIGDINTGEIYGFGEGHKPSRTRFGVKSPMKAHGDIPLTKKYVLLKDHTEDFPGVLQKLFRAKNGGIFKDIEISSGSIGLLVARLWKNEVGMFVLRPDGFNTPWDNTPLIGMNKVMDIVHIKYNIAAKEVEVFDPTLPKEITKKDYIEILIHKDYADEVIDWINQHK